MKHSLQFMAAHHQKTSGLPAEASDKTMRASEAFSLIGTEISKATDESKKRRLETLDREAVEKQTRQRRLDEEDKTGEDIETMTGLAESSADDALEPSTLTPSKGFNFF